MSSRSTRPDVKVLFAEMMNNAVAASESACRITPPPVSKNISLQSQMKPAFSEVRGEGQSKTNHRNSFSAFCEGGN